MALHPYYLVFVCSLLFALGYVVGQDSSCIQNPENPQCATYQVPSGTIKASNADLCSGSMSSMPGCTVYQICQMGDYSGSREYCQPFSVYLDICEEMPMMSNCSIYSSMCTNTSVVPECKTASLPLPSTSETKDLIDEMCSLMEMPQCSDCDTSCNYLEVYSDLCISMPDMSGCDAWKKLCMQIPNWPLCSKPSLPPMRMYFHTGITDYVLFQPWVPYSTLTYAGTWAAVFLATVLLEFLKLFRTRWEKKWADQLTDEYMSLNGGGNSFLAGEAPFRLRVDTARAFLHVIEVAWGFLVMLVVMTYNVGLFLSVLAGSFIGMLLIGRISKRQSQYVTLRHKDD